MKKEDLLAYYSAQTVDKERMYTKPFRRYQQRRRLETVRELALRSWRGRRDARVADIGCGDGYGTSVILDGLGYSRFVGLDLSPEKLHSACRNIDACRAVLGDAEGLPFCDESFDVIFSLETLEHLIDPSAALREVHRVLRAGGMLLLSVPVRSGLNVVLSTWWTGLRRRGSFREHLQVFTVKSMVRLVHGAGLNPREHRCCVFNYPCFEIFTRLIPYRLWKGLDRILSAVPLRFTGAKYGFSFGFGSEYLVVEAHKEAAGRS
jgi:ubiquinone/menaquinone biosynthesis C-methylase UbiE